MNRAILFCFLSITFSECDTQRPKDSVKEEWIRLFNGKDLSGWDLKIAGHELNDNYNQTFQVSDSALRIDYSRYTQFDGKFGHIYYHEPYSYYRIRLEYMFVGKQIPGAPEWGYLNSGIMVHSQSAQSVNKAQTFPVSLEMQLLASEEGRLRTTGNLCTPGTQASFDGTLMESHCVNAHSRNYPRDKWISAEVIVLGDSIIHHVIDGDTVLTYEHPIVGGGFVAPNNNWTMAAIVDSLLWINKAGTPLREGYIALQAESQPLSFRRIELLNLQGCMDPKAKNYKSYYLKSDNTKCEY